ncbi:hypothetical protein I5W35_19280 [Stenotrophomonas maltophilia]|nr:hypothetical protein [Stenotrophomonas maltophilia]
MAVTEQLSIRLEAGEKKALSAAARKSNLKVSEYVRGRLFGSPFSEADQLLLDGLVDLRPRLEASLDRINANMKHIAQLREAAADSDAHRPRLPDDLSPADLAAIAANLGLAASPAAPAPAKAAR